MVAAARALVGGDGCARMSSRERARGGERMQRVREKSEGTRGVVVARIRTKGGLQREAGGGRRRRAPRLASARPPGRGGRGQRRRRWAGPAGGTGPALVAARVRPGKWASLSFFFSFTVLFYFNSVFYFAGLFLICFNIKSFYKILEIIMGAF